MLDADLGKFTGTVAELRKLMARIPESARYNVFTGEIVDTVAGLIPQGLERALAADVLNEIAETHGLADDRDTLQTIISDAFRQVDEPDMVPDEEPTPPHQDEPAKPKRNGKDGKAKGPTPKVQSKAEFIARYVPPNYLIDGMLQRRFVYALTGVTGHAKSAIALTISQLISSSTPNAVLGSHHVDKGRVAYFVGENPDDIRMRVIGADAIRTKAGEHPDEDQIAFIPGIFNIGEMFATLHRQLSIVGAFDLVIVDTSAAYFLGKDEISNTEMGTHARMLRGLTELPGSPCVLILCHPIKHATEPSQLLPRGGGAFLNEMDGNLTSWKEGDRIELHHNKMRGPGFEPLSFRLETIRTSALVDIKGREIPTVRAVPIARQEEETIDRKAREEEDLLLAKMLARPDASIADLAEACGWVSITGDPSKSRVHRRLIELAKNRPALVRKDQNRWLLTEEGKNRARKAALAIAARDMGGAQSEMNLH